MNKVRIFTPTGLTSIVLLFLLSFSTSCVVLLGGSKNKVEIISKTKGVTLSANGKIIGKGDHAKESFKKADRAIDIKVDKDGYLSKNDVLFLSNKINHLYWLNVPFCYFGGMGFLGLWLDWYSPKIHKYPKKITLAEMTKEPTEKSEEKKFLKINRTGINIATDDTVAIYYRNYNRYLKGKIMSSSTWSEKIEYEQTRFTSTLTQFLEKYNYVDTSNSIFPNYTNTCYIEGDISNVIFNVIKASNKATSSYGTSGVSAKVKVKWTILDYFKVPKDSIFIDIESDKFRNESSYFDKSNEGYIKALDNAVELSLVKLLDNKKFAEIISSETINKNTEPLIINSKPYSTKSLNDLVKSAVTIKNNDKGQGHGSGFMISSDGYIITNYHVVANNNKIKVIANNGVKYDAKIIRTSPLYDVALLKVDAYNVPHMNLKNMIIDKYELGSSISTIGTPNSVELGQSVAKGTLSGMRAVNNLHYIQTNIAINGGNSGGALLNEDGKVVGVVTAKLSGMGIEGIAFAIPTRYILEGLNLKIN